MTSVTVSLSNPITLIPKCAEIIFKTIQFCLMDLRSFVIDEMLKSIVNNDKMINFIIFTQIGLIWPAHKINSKRNYLRLGDTKAHIFFFDFNVYNIVIVIV